MTGRVLILVENLPVPFDRRVWQEALALRDAGYDVTVICPRTRRYPAAREVLEGVEVLRYPAPYEARRAVGYPLEYGNALVQMLRLAAVSRRRGRFAVIQACNPPDLLFLVALPFVLADRTPFVFDHHDVSPELLLAKRPHGTPLLLTLTKVAERLTFALASVSIATNASYREVALTRGRMAPDDVFIVRSGPDLRRFAGGTVRPELRRGRDHLVAYVGVMGSQEGIDHLLDAAEVLVRQERRDVMFVLAGSGPEHGRLRHRAGEMGLAEHVVFPGRISDAELLDLLATADVCVNPDEVNRMNDISTMNKVLEYMAMAKPIVQFDLHEGRVSAGEASMYAAANDPRSLAAALGGLLDDPVRGKEMGLAGRARVEGELTWERQVPALLAAYDRAQQLGPRRPRSLPRPRRPGRG